MKQRSLFFFRAFSTKARRRLFFLLILIVLLLVLISPKIERKPQVALIERPLVAVVTTIQEGITRLSSGVVQIWNRWIGLLSLQKEHQVLIQEVQRLRLERTALQEQVLAADRMRKLLQLRDTLNTPMIAAQVVARDPTNWYRMVVLDKGEEEGVVAGRGVLSSEGVVGRVIKTSSHTARVLLITDRGSAMAGLTQRNRVSGILEGGENGKLSFQYVPLDESVLPGDLVLTSGLEGSFPKGLVVGTVSRVDLTSSPLFMTIEVTPAVDISRLEEVWVLDPSGTPESLEIEPWRLTP